MSMVESIIKKHSACYQESISEVSVDQIYLQDGNSPTIAYLFEKHNIKSIKNPENVHVFFDHSVLAANSAIANRLKDAELFCHKYRVNKVRLGEGISHIVALEKKIFQPGNIVVGSDSHTITGGIYQSLALGMGVSDVIGALVTGKTWLKIPSTLAIYIQGKFNKILSTKDLMLHLLAAYSAQRFLYKSIEWCGPAIITMDQSQVITLANMSVELGAKCCFVSKWHQAPVDLLELNPDGNEQINIDLENLLPLVAAPGSIYNAKVIDHFARQKIDYVFIGSCANSHIEDIAQVARIVDGKTIHSQTRLIVTPGSRQIYLQAVNSGYIQSIIKAGGLVTPPGCGTCVGTQGFIPADGEHVLSTMNRNFIGRMGNPRSSIWLSSPKVAAVAALCGYIPTSSELMREINDE